MRRRRGRAFKCIGRWTVPRQLILDVFINNRGHLAAEEVFMRIKRNNPGIGLATVYRNLEFLHRQGLLNRFKFHTDRAHYELNDDDREHHHHLICRKCGKVIDYSEFVERELKLMKDLEKELSHKHGFRIERHDLNFIGLCTDCKV